MKEWLEKIAGVLCVMTVMLQLIPEGSFAKYVRFYASLLYLLVTAGPLLRLFTQEDLLDQFLNLELIREEHYDLETAVTGLQDLKNETFQSAWQNEVIRQIGEIVGACKGRMEDAELLTGEDYSLQKVNIKIWEEDAAGNAAAQIQQEVAEIFSVAPEQVQIIRLGENE